MTGNPILRACITISSNPDSTRKFYKYELTNGTFGRMVFSYKPRGNRDGKIPHIGKFTDEFYEKLDEYLARLDLCKGGSPRFRFPQGSRCSIYNLPVLNRLRPGEALYIAEGCSDCWSLLSAGHKAARISASVTFVGNNPALSCDKIGLFFRKKLRECLVVSKIFCTFVA